MNRIIPALTLWQPWASLMHLGPKTIETRGWATRYRGPLAIHAAARRLTKKEIWHIKFDCGDWEAIRKAMKERGLWPPENLPLGKVLCVRRMVACRPTRELRDNPQYAIQLPFGDFSDGRFGWITEKLLDFHEPIKAQGQRGIWDWECPDVQG